MTTEIKTWITTLIKKKNEQRLQFVLENDIKRELTTPHSSSQEHTLHDDGTVGRRNTAVL